MALPHPENYCGWNRSGKHRFRLAPPFIMYDSIYLWFSCRCCFTVRRVGRRSWQQLIDEGRSRYDVV